MRFFVIVNSEELRILCRSRNKVMPEPSTWRELLSQIISSLAERERIASAMSINPMTLNRWVSGESTPRPQNLRQLQQVVPQQYRVSLHTLLEQEFPTLFSSSPPDSSQSEIAYAFIMQVFDTRAKTPDALRFWTISRSILQHALRQLDQEHSGMAMTVVRCMPPSAEGRIRSLRESVGQGTPPWESDLEAKGMFLGAESLAGYAVATCHEEAVQNLATDTMLLPAYQTDYEVSAMASPILYANRVAGCLLLSSTQPNYFLSPARLSLIHGYTQLLALAFDAEEFYPPEMIELSIMPPIQVQQQYFVNFRQRVYTVMRKSSDAAHPFTGIQAEQEAWQQLEEELSGLFLRSIPKGTTAI